MYQYSGEQIIDVLWLKNKVTFLRATGQLRSLINHYLYYQSIKIYIMLHVKTEFLSLSLDLSGVNVNNGRSS